MNYQVTHIKKYRIIINEKISRYKKQQQLIWNYYFKRLTNIQSTYINERDNQPRNWYNYCLWELKYLPTINSKCEIFEKKIEDQLNIYINIILQNKYFKNLNRDIILYIVQYIY